MIERILRKDLIAKVTAVILALIMWVNAVEIKNPPKAVSESLAIITEAPAGKVITSLNPTSVSVTFEGRARALTQVKASELTIPVDIPKSGASSVTIPIVFKSPYPGVEVIDIVPKNVVIGLDDWVTKEVGIKLATMGQPNEEFLAEKPVANVGTVSVSGAKRKVDQVWVVSGEVDVTGAVAKVSSKVSLSARDPAGNEIEGVEIEPPDLEVTVPMTARPPAKTVPIRAETTGTIKEGYKIGRTTVSPEAVEIRGEISITRDIDALYTKPVDISGREATFNYSTTLDVPSGVTAKTTRVTVSVEILEDIVEKSFNGVVVQLENLPAGYHFGLEPPVVDIALTGRSDVIGRIEASDLQAFIDADLIVDPKEQKIEKKLPVDLRGVPEGVTADTRPGLVKLILTRRGS